MPAGRTKPPRPGPGWCPAGTDRSRLTWPDSEMGAAARRGRERHPRRPPVRAQPCTRHSTTMRRCPCTEAKPPPSPCWHTPPVAPPALARPLRPRATRTTPPPPPWDAGTHRVPFHCQLSVGLLKVIFRRPLGHPKDAVIVLAHADGARPSPSAAPLLPPSPPLPPLLLLLRQARRSWHVLPSGLGRSFG